MTSAAEAQAVLDVQRASCTIWPRCWQKAKQPRIILNNISFQVRSKEVLAIMGPSGAGKTQLMNFITLENGPGVATGRVSLNGEKMTRELFRKFCTFVPQSDTHWAFLTCRETLQFAADFFLGASRNERTRAVDEMLERMGLLTCQNTRVGNQFIPGLSGGEKRRLSIGVALLKTPKIMFLDEPTSGLDSAAAASIMTFLREVASKENLAVVCTIHQPSSKVFAGFHNTLVLSAGAIAYNGPAREVTKYFSSVGYPVPEHENPAEFMLDLVNRAFTEPERVDSIMAAWATKAATESLGEVFEAHKLPSKGQYGVGLHRMVQASFRRQALLVLRDPTMYTGRIVMFMLACCFFSIVYIKSRDRVQEQAFNRLWLLLWFVGVPTNFGIICVLGTNLEFFAVRKETKDGMYHPLVHLVANAVLQIPMLIVMSMSAVTLAGYGIANWNADQYVLQVIVFALIYWSFECVAQLLAVLANNPLIGMLGFMNFWFVSFLFAGMIIKEDDVQMPLRLFCYISPLRWGISTASYVEFSDTTYGGAEPSNGSYMCPGLANRMNCLGYTGKQVLESMHMMFSVVTPEDNTLRNISIIVGFCLAAKVGYAAVFIARCSASRTITALEVEDVAESQGTGSAAEAASSVTADLRGKDVLEAGTFSI
eukprot:TRINITY_DN60466_c0_g1_i1.p1 TRINITY_DN60466_c0_g1~~TRINITY_DN60466_c0_g1_i1.p1  ORF type:complete len:660 (+),score=105.20 TRINITY_DN60466_c0_g1_i1:27-1982(+)